jgi:hypothetical protein
MNVLIDINVLILLLAVAAIAICAAVFIVMTLNKRAPEGKIFALARMTHTPAVFNVHPNNTITVSLAKKEKGAETGNYFTTDRGRLKFTDASGQNHALLSGNLPIYFYSENLPVSINLRLAQHMDYLVKELARQDLSLTGIEDIFYQVLSKVYKRMDENVSPDKIMDEVLDWVQVRDDATREKVKLAVDYCIENRAELEKVEKFIRPTVFSLQAIVRGIDAAIGYTSQNALQAKSIYEMAAMHKAKGEGANIMMYAMGFAILIGAMAFGAKFMGWV